MATKVLTATKEPEQATKMPEATLQLEGAAALLLGLLDERERFLIEQTCEGQQLTQWMYIAGILKRSLDTGEHTLPTVDPLWRTWTGGWHAKLIADCTCPICNKTFTPQWRGQLYDTNECGALAQRSKLSASTSELLAYTVGEEPADVLKSTIRDTDAGAVQSYEQALSQADNDLQSAIGKRAATGGLGQATSMDTAG